MFTVIAASTVAVPVVAYLVAEERMRGPLDSLKEWLQENNATVMATLILVIGAVLLGKGVSGLWRPGRLQAMRRRRGIAPGLAGVRVPAGLPDGGAPADVVAGLTVWAVLVPEALAYATIAGVPPVVGLYAAVPALVLYAAFGQFPSSRGRADVGNRCAVRSDRRSFRGG